MDPLARNLTNQVLSSSATWKREAGYIVLLFLTGNLVTNLFLALAFILWFLDSNYQRESVQILPTLHDLSDNTRKKSKGQTYGFLGHFVHLLCEHLEQILSAPV